MIHVSDFISVNRGAIEVWKSTNHNEGDQNDND